jgi:hypothetical protein
MPKQKQPTHKISCLVSRNRREAQLCWGASLRPLLYQALDRYSREFRFSISAGDLLLLDGNWFVTHSGLMRLARRYRCNAIQVEPATELCNPGASRFVFRAIVYKTANCRGFTGYGDADPSNVSLRVHGAEMRIAETRAVNRALRKAYGIGICSVEEVGSFSGTVPANREPRQTGKLPPQPAHCNGSGGHGHNGNGNGSRVRDRLCQLIRQHQLDAHLVKSYATDFCGTKTLREATREQVESFVVHLADWAEKDRNALLCQLNSYSRPRAGAA